MRLAGPRRAMAWAVAAAFAAVAAGAARPASALPSFDAVRAAHHPSDLVVVDRHGEALQSLRIDDTRRVAPWVPIEAMSPALLQALVRGEDRRFWEHAGVDWAALAAAAWRSAWDGRTRGASTLTMQLAALLDDDLRRPAGGRDLLDKAGQVATALALERRWSKSQILEAYLNLVGWRGETVGIGALAQTLFDKQPHGLDTHEAAIAAALVRGPNADAATVARRACALLPRAASPAATADPACTEIEALARRALQRRGGPLRQAQVAPHAARLALAVQPRSGQLVPLAAARRDAALADGRLVTTLDARLQRLARETLRTQLAELSGHRVGDGAVIVLDNASGEVRAWVGSVGDASSAPAVDAVLARRQAGSTLKPFAYQAAFAQGLLAPSSRLDDSPAQIPTGAGLWQPRNYDHRHRGWVDARTALAASLNVPAVRVAQLVGVDTLHATLQAAGVELDRPSGHYGLSLALGSADVTLLALANGYRTLANGGLWSPLRLVPAADAAAAVSPRRVADAAATAAVTSILADATARAPGFGLDSPLATRRGAAVKTGTSRDLRDNWCVGYTARHTVAVWVGNAGGEPMHRVGGTTGAAPVWQALVAALDDPPPPAAVRPPSGPAQAVAKAASGPPLRGPMLSGIANPADGSVLALDPDIPLPAQRLWLEGERGQWWLDGRHLGDGTRLAWTPRPGRHRLALRDASGREIDAVRFEVRAAPPPR